MPDTLLSPGALATALVGRARPFLDQLGQMLRATCEREGVSIRGAARASGIRHDKLMRVASGRLVLDDNELALLAAWLDKPVPPPDPSAGQ